MIDQRTFHEYIVVTHSLFRSTLSGGNHRPTVAYVNYKTSNSEADQSAATRAFAAIAPKEKTKLTRKEYYGKVAKTKFVVSPRG